MIKDKIADLVERLQKEQINILALQSEIHSIKKLHSIKKQGNAYFDFHSDEIQNYKAQINLSKAQINLSLETINFYCDVLKDYVQKKLNSGGVK